MHIGGMFPYGQVSSMAEYLDINLSLGYRAVVYPAEASLSEENVALFERYCRQHRLVVAEVGIWNNPVSPDPKERMMALEQGKLRLALAERLHARCCVNVSGSAGSVWYAPYPQNFTPEHVALAVRAVQEIIDAVQPQHTCFALEPMQWMVPDSPESYLSLIAQIDRPAFKVHMDICNLLFTPRRLLGQREYMDACFEKLGPFIRSCHVKDLRILPDMAWATQEVVPGRGQVDLPYYLQKIEAQDPDLPVIIEHLSGRDQYYEALRHVRNLCRESGIALDA